MQRLRVYRNSEISSGKNESKMFLEVLQISF